jgi:hypothetical protein
MVNAPSSILKGIICLPSIQKGRPKPAPTSQDGRWLKQDLGPPTLIEEPPPQLNVGNVALAKLYEYSRNSSADTLLVTSFDVLLRDPKAPRAAQNADGQIVRSQGIDAQSLLRSITRNADEPLASSAFRSSDP